MTACNELEKTVPIIVLGASGYAGQLVTRELKARNLEFVVADIDSHKLETLVQELGGGIQWEKIDILDAPALEKYCEKGRVLINCAGPYSFLGEPVINAVIKAKTHCIDFSEESKYLIDVRNRHDEIKQQGITIINGVGMGGALGDIAAAMAGAGFESVESVDIAYAFQSVQFSRGTLSSILSVLQEESLLGFEDGEWKSVRIGGHTATFDYPPPIGRRVGFDIPGAEILFTPRHLKIKRWVRIYIAFYPIVAYTLGFLAPVVVWLARSPLGKWAMNFMRKTQSGPSDKERAAFKFYFKARVIIEQDGKSTVRRVILQGQDAYATTAKLAVNTALAMLQPDFRRSGALTMPQAFDLEILEKILQETGVSFPMVS